MSSSWMKVVPGGHSRGAGRQEVGWAANVQTTSAGSRLRRLQPLPPPAAPSPSLTRLLHADDEGQVPRECWVVVLCQVLLTTTFVALLWRRRAAPRLVGLAQETVGLRVEDLGRGETRCQPTRCEEGGCCQRLQQASLPVPDGSRHCSRPLPLMISQCLFRYAPYAQGQPSASGLAGAGPRRYLASMQSVAGAFVSLPCCDAGSVPRDVPATKEVTCEKGTGVWAREPRATACGGSLIHAFSRARLAGSQATPDSR